MLTGEELIQTFKSLCDKSNKLFIPDSPRQEAVAEALVQHYDEELLIKSIEFHINKNTGPFLVFDFAIVSRTLFEKIKYEEEAKNRFRNLVRETHDRMASE